MKKFFDTVVNANTGRAVEGATVTFLDSDGNPVVTYADDAFAGAATTTTTDENGLYQRYVPNGTYTIRQTFGNVSIDIPGVEIFDDSIQEDTITRALLVPEGETGVILPEIATRAGKYLVFDATGNPAISDGSGADAAMRTDLAASGGSSLVGFVQPSSGAVTRTAQSKLGEVVSVKDFGAVGDGTTDDTSAIQAAVNAAAGGVLYFPPGRYLISSAINIVSRVHIYGVRNAVTIILGTQNQNGLVVGDGTSPTRAACGGVVIRDIDFNAKAGVSASVSGSAIYINYTYDTRIEHCTFYGLDGSTKKLFNGVAASKATNHWIYKCNFIGLLGYGHATSGTSSATADKTINGRVIDCEFINITLDCIYLGPYSEGIWLHQINAYQFTAAAIHINTSLFNFQITAPNIELSGTSSGVYVESGENVQVTGGWIGGSGSQVGLSVGVSSSRVHADGVIFTASRIDIQGPACSVNGCDVVGDSVTSADGITIASTATGTSILGGKVHQWPGVGIKFTGEAGRSVVAGVSFALNGSNITGDAWAPGGNAPVNISGCASNGTFALTAASTLPIYHGRYFYQPTGVTPITGLTLMAAGTVVTLQAGAGGIALTNSGSLYLKGGVDASVPASSTITLVSGGTGWLEMARSF